MKNLRKRAISLVLIITVAMTALFVIPVRNVGAATGYITVESFAKSLAKEIGLKSISGDMKNGYINALLKKGIIKEGDFKSYTSYLTRGDAMVLLNRADEYLYGDKLDPDLVQLAIDKRISDIKKVKEAKRADVAKAYLKGFMKGGSNGDYCTDRNMKVNNKITKTGALNCIKLIKNKKLRAKISPDGQLIRTTNLPKNADRFPYILASYPNSYYNWRLNYEGFTTYTKYNPETGRVEEFEDEYLKDYASPADIDKTTDIENFPQVRKENIDIWVDKVKTHMECIFNVDYRTIGQEWIDKMAKVQYTYGYQGMDEQTRERLQDYVDGVKKEKTIIECSKVAVDGSSLYFSRHRYYLRVYVKYRIVSTKCTYSGGDFWSNNTLFYTSTPIQLKDVALGKWKECCFDVALTKYDNKEPENLGVAWVDIDELFYSKKY